jgi:hypothetical protein
MQSAQSVKESYYSARKAPLYLSAPFPGRGQALSFVLAIHIHAAWLLASGERPGIGHL